MSSLESVKASNIVAASALQSSPVAVFVGGTSGIGQGMAEAFARWTGGKAHIIIVGRNQAAADAIIAKFPKPSSEEPTGTSDGPGSSSSSPTWSHSFVKCDATLMRNVRTAAGEILAKHGKVNFLVQSPGVMAMDGRSETEEGIDRKLAVHYYARWTFIHELLPALRKAKDQGEDAKVISVFSAGKGGEINMDDLGLVKTFSLAAAGLQVPTYNDLMMEEFAIRNPNIAFIHSYPGGVKTGLFSASTSKLLNIAGAATSALFSPFLTSQDDCAEYMWNAVFSCAAGMRRAGSKGEDIGRKRYFGNEEQRKKLWEHTVKTVKVDVEGNYESDV